MTAATYSLPRRFHLVIPIVGEALLACVVQFCPMVFLGLEGYAMYAGIYLAYAAALSIMFAVLSDVWARQIRKSKSKFEFDRAHQSTLTFLTLATAAVSSICIGWLMDVSLLTAVIAAVGAGFAVYRAGTRYRLIAMGRMASAGSADIAAAVIGLGSASVLVMTERYSLQTSLGIWLIISIVSVLLNRSKPCFDFPATIQWMRSNKGEISALVGDTALMNVSSVVMPFTVGAIATPVTFAILRAATSVVYPVRLVMSSVRARIVANPMSTGGVRIALIALCGLVLGSALTGSLAVVDSLGLAHGSTLEVLATHALSVGFLGVFTTISLYLQFTARGVLAPAQILYRRIVHTIVLFTITVAAVVVDPDLVVWSAALSTALTCGIWWQRPRPHRADR